MGALRRRAHGGPRRAPREYERRTVGFLDRALLSPGPAGAGEADRDALEAQPAHHARQHLAGVALGGSGQPPVRDGGLREAPLRELAGS